MDDPQLRLRAIAELYEAYPYPPVGLFSGLFQRVRWEERQTLNYRALYGATFGSCAGAAERPRILVAGCGTFEPIVVALANPRAEIVAVDLSGRSLRLLQRQARRHGCAGRIFAVQADLLDLPRALGSFDYLIATGVIHHLPDPLAGLHALTARASDRAVFRFMIYSFWGRALLYAAKRLAGELGVDNPRAFRRMIESLPAGHPYRVYFHLYGDSATDTGVADGFLHPCDHAFTARELGAALGTAGLETAFFLHGPEGQPEAATALGACPAEAGPWERLAVLEAFGELQENFRFVARRAGAALAAQPPAELEWNEALPPKGKLFSTRLGRHVVFDRSFPPFLLGTERREELLRALFLAPKGET